MLFPLSHQNATPHSGTAIPPPPQASDVSQLQSTSIPIDLVHTEPAHVQPNGQNQLLSYQSLNKALDHCIGVIDGGFQNYAATPLLTAHNDYRLPQPVLQPVIQSSPTYTNTYQNSTTNCEGIQHIPPTIPSVTTAPDLHFSHLLAPRPPPNQPTLHSFTLLQKW